MLNKNIALLIHYRWLWLVLSLMLTAFSTSGFKHFFFDASPRSYFKEGHEAYDRFKEVEDRYGRDYRVFFMLSAKTGDMFAKENLRALLDITERGWTLPLVRRVDSLSNYQHTFSDNDELIVEDFITAEFLDNQAILQQRKELATSDIDIVNRLISPDAKHATVLLSTIVTGDDREAEFALVEKAYELEEAIKAQHPNIDIALTGNLLSNYHTIQIAVKDMTLMIPIMYGLMFIMIGLFFRSISSVFISLIIAGLSATSAIGFSSLAGIEFSTLAINAVIISITVSVAHCIHIFSQFFVELKDKTKQEAIKQSLQVNFFAISMTSLTTAIGFLSLNFNDLPPAVALGNAAAMGTILAWIFSLTALPALVVLLPFKAHTKEHPFLEKIMFSLGNWVIKNKTLLVIFMGSLTALMIYLSFSNVLNDRFSEMIHKPHIFRTDIDTIDENFGALYVAHFDINSGEENGITDPQYLNNLDKLANFLRAQPDVRNVHSFADIVKRLNQSMHDNDPSFYTIPESRELTAQYVLLYEMSLPYGLDLNDQVSLDKSRSRLIVNMPSVDTRNLIDIENRVWQWQQENLPEINRHKGAAMSIIWAHLSRNSLINSLEGSIIALSLISLILLIVLRSLRYGLISLIPNLVPAAFGFGIWFFISGEVGLSLTCVIIITIGIVVDDTVHFLSKYKKALDSNNGDSEKAILITFKQVGPALCITTMVLASGFSVLALSKIIANSSLGSVTAIILIAALILDLLLLPALILLVDKKPKVKKEAHSEKLN